MVHILLYIYNNILINFPNYLIRTGDLTIHAFTTTVVRSKPTELSSDNKELYLFVYFLFLCIKNYSSVFLGAEPRLPLLGLEVLDPEPEVAGRVFLVSHIRGPPQIPVISRDWNS